MHVERRRQPARSAVARAQAPGHCLYACDMGSGEDLEQVFTRNVLDYIEKNYPKYFQAPE